MKRRGLRNGVLVLCLLSMFMLFPMTAFAVGSIEPDKDAALTVHYVHEGVPVGGSAFRLYYMASVYENEQFTLLPEFARYPISTDGLDQKQWRELAVTLDGYVHRDGIVPTAEGETDANGMLSFGNALKPGMYLLLSEKQTVGDFIYTVSPAVIALPEREPQTGAWNYDVTVEPKHQVEPVQSEPITRKVLKIWDDKGSENQRPNEIEVQLLKDGGVYDTVKLNKDNNWRYTWDDLDANCEWTVVEKEVKGYTTKVGQSGITFTITNSKPSTPPPTPPGKPQLPQTGQLWWPVPILFVAGLAILLAGIVRHRRGDYEEK